jgi:catechol 2,3-dioxygenase-like lactoylglutathione lyase family enzyme
MACLNLRDPDKTSRPLRSAVVSIAQSVPVLDPGARGQQSVPDLTAAKRYYDALMPLVGFEPFFHAVGEFAYKPVDNKPGTYLFFYPATEPGTYSPERIGLQHLAFIVRRRSSVDRVHDHVVRIGGRVIHAARHFPRYPGRYYATFWYDPWGIKLEAVCHHDLD